MKVAILTVDAREFYKDYDRPPYFGTAPEALLKGFAQLPDVETHVIGCVRAPLPPVEKLAPNVTYHALRVPRIGWLSTLYAGCILATRRKLRELQPDIVHGQGTERDSAFTAALSGFPNVVTVHGNVRQVITKLGAAPFSALWMIGRIEAWTLRKTQGVVCLTNYTLQQVRDLARRTWVVPNAVDESFFGIQRNANDSTAILCVANILPYKNQNFLIRALDPVAEKLGLRLIFLGSKGVDENYCQEFFDLVKTRPWCSHEGFKKGDELKAYLSSARLLVLPTLEDNCPMVALEAMAAGLPIAASRIGGVPDLIDHGVTGLMFDPHSADEMREAIVKLFSNQPWAEQMGAAGQQRAREQHRPVQIARRHVEIYRELLSARS